MKKTIYSKFDKQAISDLPRATFPGRIVVVLSKSEADRAVDFLLQQPILGFDTETRPSFKRGQTYKVSLLQVATRYFVSLKMDIIKPPHFFVEVLNLKLITVSIENQ